MAAHFSAVDLLSCKLPICHPAAVPKLRNFTQFIVRSFSLVCWVSSVCSAMLKGCTCTWASVGRDMTGFAGLDQKYRTIQIITVLWAKLQHKTLIQHVSIITTPINSMSCTRVLTLKHGRPHHQDVSAAWGKRMMSLRDSAASAQLTHFVARSCLGHFSSFITLVYFTTL